MIRRFASCALALLLISKQIALAQENFSGFNHVDENGNQLPVWGQTGAFGPVPTEKASVANLAPVLLRFFNNGTVFGLPGTEVGDFWNRTQLTGDWGGVRTDLARRGVFIDLYSTSTYQNMASGGLKTGDAFVENLQLSINIDTGRAGLWPGGLSISPSCLDTEVRRKTRSPRVP
jgi:porin